MPITASIETVFKDIDEDKYLDYYKDDRVTIKMIASFTTEIYHIFSKKAK